MKILTLLVVALFAAIIFPSCSQGTGGEPRIDGSSAEAFETSVKKVTESLPTEEAREEFIAILALVAMEAINLDGPADAAADVLAVKLDGLTATEFLDHYRPLLEESRKKVDSLKQERQKDQ